ncbi:purine and uridine phosphorylase [Xylaria digitata]|nr:purine and uridine phosphorylase [Xylaria digitata]
MEYPSSRPATRHEFEIAILCALPLEADAVAALFDQHWDHNGPPYDKAPGDPNAYTTGVMGRHNVVLVHMPGRGKVHAAAVAANCRASFPNIKLAAVVGICGAVPFGPDGSEIVLGDVIISEGVVQYDLGRRHPDRFVRKDTVSDSLGRPTAEIRSLLSKLKTRYDRKMLQDKLTKHLKVIQHNPGLEAQYPGVVNDRLLEATYHHTSEGRSCDEGGCSGPLVPRRRLEQGNTQPKVHFGLVASGDTVMGSGEERDSIARRECVLGFETEGAGIWDSFPCVVIKGVCNYADSHKTKAWQRYAGATAAACLKAFLEFWIPSPSFVPGMYYLARTNQEMSHGQGLPRLD